MTPPPLPNPFPYRAVITGIGVVSPIGNDLHAFVRNLFAGSTGIDRNESSVPAYAAQVKDFADDLHVGYDRSIRFALAAAHAAKADAVLRDIDPARTAVAIASSKGGITSFCIDHRQASASGSLCPATLPNSFMFNYLPSSPAAAVAEAYDCRGATVAPVAACAAGSHAVIAGATMVASGEADVVFAGATEAAITPLMGAGFARLGVLAQNGLCRPFDRDRSGFVMGEGAAIFIIERADLAQKRGARPYAEVAGYSRASDATSLVSLDPAGRSIATAITKAMRMAGMTAADIDYINAHATGTERNDSTEASALRAAFGPDASRIAVSGTKAITGHLLGAAGAIETAICLLAMQHDTIPATINHRETALECSGLNIVTNHAKIQQVKVALNLSFGFGGQIGVIILRKAT